MAMVIQKVSLFYLVKVIWRHELFGAPITLSGIAVCHSAFNILCTMLLLPMSSLLERLAYALVPDKRMPDTVVELDERLLTTPSIALEQCHVLAVTMAEGAMASIKGGAKCLFDYQPEIAEEVRRYEEKTDHYEDVISSFLIKLNSAQVSARDSAEATKILKIIGDLERISDHAVNLVDSAEELRDKQLTFSDAAIGELTGLTKAIDEIVELAYDSFAHNHLSAAVAVEPLEQIIDEMKEKLRTSHILRLRQGACGVETGFVWSDILTDLERTSDHCSNIAGCVIDMEENNMNLHESLRSIRNNSPYYQEKYNAYAEKYLLQG